jgi:uncharacterized membrane protein
MFALPLDLDFLGSTAGAWWVFGKPSHRRGTAQEELLRRLDDGEISQEDYERRLRLLGDSSPSP